MIVILQGFKEYFALGFFQGALLKDPEKMLPRSRGGSSFTAPRPSESPAFHDLPRKGSGRRLFREGP
jgi:hypothetical protein